MLFGIAKKGEGYSRITIDLMGEADGLSKGEAIKHKGEMERHIGVKLFPLKNHKTTSKLGDFWPAH